MTDDAARFAACVGAPAVVVAMAEEAEPFLADADSRCENPHVIGGAELYAVEAAGRPVLVVRTGIGLVNAASTLSVMLERFAPSSATRTRTRPPSGTNRDRCPGCPRPSRRRRSS